LKDRYAVRYRVSPAPDLRSPSHETLDGPDGSTLHVRNYNAPGGHDVNVHAGLEIDLYLLATSLDDAIWTGSSIVTGLMAEITTTSAARCGMPREVVVVQLGSSDGRHAYREYVLVNQDVSRRFFSIETLRATRTAIWGLHPDLQESVWRAIKSYQQALESLDPLVEFMVLWAAIESLNVPLGRRAGQSKPRPLEGCRAFFETRVVDGRAFYRDAKELRNDWLHGSRDLKGLGERSRKMLEIMELATREAIAYACGTEWVGERKPIKHWPLQLFVQVELTVPPGQPLAPDGEIPVLGIELLPRGSFSREGNDIKQQFEVKFRPDPLRKFQINPSAAIGFIGEQVATAALSSEDLHPAPGPGADRP
jgi:hypothetical protein